MRAGDCRPQKIDSRPNECRQHADHVDVGRRPQSVLGGAAEEHDRTERVAQRLGGGLDEVPKHTGHRIGKLANRFRRTG